ncbi:hypothetical protein [Halolamina sediminis]|jgi:hypothetical protein|uniref:hypothetical protein n=1 Tax=Halolamina sediminis TaxID=1480675 RepID=UPI00192A08E8|nr:hypothetical protein [Halolamina sediminis]
MDRRRVAGGGLLVAGLLSYGVGLYVPYPGRAFSLTAVMVGIVLVTTGAGPQAEGAP